MSISRQERTLHAPGPWTLKKLDVNHSMVHAADGMTVVPRMITEPGTASEGSGHLIVAGPDLLAALKEAVQDCPCSVAERASGHRIDCRAPSWKEVIDKAEGQS